MSVQPIPLVLKHPSLLKKNLSLLAGQWVKADSGQTITVTNPADGSVVGEVPRCAWLWLAISKIAAMLTISFFIVVIFIN